MSDSIVQGTDRNFEQVVVESEVPVLVDFWAPWCGPCHQVGPVLEQIAEDYEGRARVVKVNVDEEQGVAGALGVRSIPTIALFHDGEVKDVLVGVRPKADFAAAIDKTLAA